MSRTARRSSAETSFAPEVRGYPARETRHIQQRRRDRSIREDDWQMFLSLADHEEPTWGNAVRVTLSVQGVRAARATGVPEAQIARLRRLVGVECDGCMLTAYRREAARCAHRKATRRKHKRRWDHANDN